MYQMISDTYQHLFIRPLQRVTLLIEQGLNITFTQKYNPFYYHGALPNFFLWVLFATGLLLFAYYKPTLETAYASVEYMTKEIPSGAFLRALHRYAADGMMIVVLLHLFRVWFTDRYRQYRILPWITGIILFIVLFLIGFSGYVLIWDASSVTLTYMTINFLNQLPVAGPWLSDLLIGGEIPTDYTLTRFLFLHVGTPMLMMFLLWMHYLRITRPVTNAPFTLQIMMLGVLLLVCGVWPVGIEAPPDLSNVSGVLEVDWLYMLPHGLLAQGMGVQTTWMILLGIPVGLLVLPYLQKKQFREDYAQVVFENCTGCQMCYHDCPYEAIEMVDRDDDTKFKRLAIVDPGRCANCGLCVGACAFKAIEIPRMDTEIVFDQISGALAGGSSS